MTWALLAAVTGWAVTVTAMVRLLASQTRAHARREDLLINQLLHTAGNAWQPAPADQTEPVQREPRTWTTAPDQEPVY